MIETITMLKSRGAHNIILDRKAKTLCSQRNKLLYPTHTMNELFSKVVSIISPFANSFQLFFLSQQQHLLQDESQEIFTLEFSDGWQLWQESYLQKKIYISLSLWSIDKSVFTSYYNNMQYLLSTLNRRNFLGTWNVGKLPYVSSNRRKGNATN